MCVFNDTSFSNDFSFKSRNKSLKPFLRHLSGKNFLDLFEITEYNGVQGKSILFSVI